MTKTQYQPVIGLEVHVELATNSKMFCGCPAEHFGTEPNTHTCPVCLGLPGALPVPNKKAVEWAILLGLALDCKINKSSKFDRKNYFYPDLPKGYQISQYDEPLCRKGALELSVRDYTSQVGITRIHLEEDTGKLQHTEINGEKVALIDFNRSGVPLVEIVSEPDFHSIEEVDVYLKKLQKIIRYLGISGADMEKGSMRLEPSISLRKSGDFKLPPYRVELKNINSFRFARKALEYEISRQTELLENGQIPTQQTRGWNEAKNATVPQREKEEANDYRYFPEPDIPPMEFDDEFIANQKKLLPELPDAKSKRFQKEFGLSQYTSDILAEDKAVAGYLEEAVKLVREVGDIKDIANWIVNKKVHIASVVPGQLVARIVQSRTTSLLDKKELDKIFEGVIENNPKAVTDYKSSKESALQFLIGQAIRKLHRPLNSEEIKFLKVKMNNA